MDKLTAILLALLFTSAGASAGSLLLRGATVHTVARGSLTVSAWIRPTTKGRCMSTSVC